MASLQPDATMIEARKTRRFNRWFARHAEKRLARTFSEVRVRGLAAVAELLREHALVVVANHPAWWDAMVILWLFNRRLRADGYALMEGANLRRFAFFRRVGAFGVERGVPGDGERVVRYGAELLDRPGRFVFVFAQGRERPVTARPLGLKRGAAAIAALAGEARVVPMALRYEFGEDEYPLVCVSFGEPLVPRAEVEPARDEQERAVTAELDRIDRALVADDLTGHGFEVVLRRRPSWLARLLTWLLAKLFR